MEIYFELGIPRLVFIKGLWEELVSWGEEEYKQDPEVFIWNDQIRMEKVDPSDIELYNFNMLPRDYTDADWVFFRILENDLELIFEKEDLNKEPLVLFLKDLLGHFEKWVVILDVLDEPFDAYQINEAELIQKMKEWFQKDWSLDDYNWRSFIAYKSREKGNCQEGEVKE